MTNVKFPYEGSVNRLTNYAYYQKLLDGSHFDAFAVNVGMKFANNYDRIKYVTCNFAGLVSKVITDLLFGEEIKIKSKDNADFFKQLYYQNKLRTLLYESELNNSAIGDSVFRIRTKDEQIIIETVNPSNYFPKLDSNESNKLIDEAKIAWTEEHLGADGKPTKYLIEENHKRGSVETNIYILKSDDTILSEISAKNYNAMFGTSFIPFIDTGIDRLLVVHVPNYRNNANKFWGVSDYRDIESLMFALNNRMTKNEQILDKHSSPILAVPNNMLDENGNIQRANFDVITKGMDGVVPEYITWDASLDSAFKQIDKLIELMFMFSETSPEALGLGQGKAESGRALKMRLIRTIAKRNRKRLYYDQAIKEILETCSMLGRRGYKAGEFKSVSEEIPDIIWADGLVNDMIEDTQLEISKLEAGLTSKKRAIMNVEELDENDAEELIKEIEKEDKSIEPIDVNR